MRLGTLLRGNHWYIVGLVSGQAYICAGWAWMLILAKNWQYWPQNLSFSLGYFIIQLDLCFDAIDLFKAAK